MILGFSLAHESPTPAAAHSGPGDLAFAGPHEGDRGRYAVARQAVGSGGLPSGWEEPEYVEFEWLAPQGIADAAGVTRDVAVIRYEEHASTEVLREGEAVHLTHNLREYHYDLSDGQLIAIDNVTFRAAHVPLPDVGQPTTDWQYDERDRSFIRAGMEPEPLLCGIRNSLQGASLAAARGSTLFHDCLLAPGNPLRGGLVLEPLGTARAGGHDLLLVRASGSRFPQPGGLGASAPVVQAWFATDLPYPVRLEVHGPGAPENVTLITLVGFERGHKPLPVDSSASRGRAPALAWSPRKPEGPDETGTRHRFPLSQALAVARDDPQGLPIRDYLAGHPTSVVQAAWYEQAQSQAYESHSWRIVLSDGRDALDFSVNQKRGNPVTEAVTNPVTQLAPRAETVYVECCQSFAGGVPVDRLPAQLPTIEALHERWRAYASAGLTSKEPNSWGLRMTCHVESAEPHQEGPCENPHVLIEAGLHEYEKWENPNGDLVPVSRAHELQTSSMITVDETGRTISLRETRYEAALPRPVAVPSSLKPVARYAAPSPTLDSRPIAPLAVASHLWDLPLLPLAAGAGMAALLGALAYGIWPEIKRGLLSAFYTRFTGKDLLDSPRRKGILDAVAAEPGIGLDTLSERTGIPYQTLRHHIRLLRAGGHLRLFKVGGQWRLAARQVDAASLLRRLHLERDPALQALIDWLSQVASLDIGAAVRALRAIFQLSTSGARKVVRRAVKLGLARKERLRLELVAPTGPRASPG